jgi:hypothetical protein
MFKPSRRKIMSQNVANLRSQKTAPQPTAIHHDFTIKTPQKKHLLFPKPPSKSAHKPCQNRVHRRLKIFAATRKKITADSNKPARNTDKVEVEEDKGNAAASVAAARRLPTGSVPPETPS